MSGTQACLLVAVVVVQRLAVVQQFVLLFCARRVARLPAAAAVVVLPQRYDVELADFRLYVACPVRLVSLLSEAPFHCKQ